MEANFSSVSSTLALDIICTAVLVDDIEITQTRATTASDIVVACGSLNQTGQPAPAVVFKAFKPGWHGSAEQELAVRLALQDHLAHAPVAELLAHGHLPDGWPYFVMQDLSLSATHTNITSTDPMRPTHVECLQLAESLARLHAAFWDAPVLQSDLLTAPQAGPLRVYQVVRQADVQHTAGALKADLAIAAEEAGAQDLPREKVLQLVDRWADAWLVRMANGRNTTLIHGDAHGENIFWPRSGTAPDGVPDVRFIDLETTKRGVGSMELAYFFARCGSH